MSWWATFWVTVLVLDFFVLVVHYAYEPAGMSVAVSSQGPNIPASVAVASLVLGWVNASYK